MPWQAQQDIVAYLSQPATLGGPVERIETHAAIVFLCGERAWKLKRAVRYSYLDYSTLALRRAACEAELAINRRIAPGLYIGLQAVRRDAAGSLTLTAEGEPVEWLVVMRRFDAAAQLDHVADRDGLTEPLLRELADRVAAMHREAEATPAHGGAAGIERAIATTELNLRSAPSLDTESVAAWSGGIRAALREQAPLLEARRHAGKVRACHGDLHLRNICLLDGRPTPFDAIEFDPDLSRIDLLYDLAFLLMDLEGRGLRVPANIVFNRYHDMAGEADGMAALPLFLSLRAAIRAQVAAAAGRLQDPVDARGSRRLAARYLALALRLLQPAPTGLVAIGGLSGSGKSSLARRLAPVLGRAPGARLLRSDVIRKRLAGLVPEQRLDAARYTPAAAAAVYDHLTGAARACLAAGQSVVADAVFPRQAQRRAIEAAAGDANATFDGFWLDAPIDTLRRRMAARGIDASDATPDLLPAQQAGLEGEWLDWTRLDATQEAGGLARQAAALLARVPPD